MSDGSGPGYRVGRRSPFVMVPMELLNSPHTDAYTIAVYVALRSFCDGAGEGSRPSDARAAQRAGCGVRTFIDRRNRLRDLGWVEWKSGASAGGTNEYVIHEIQAEEGVHQAQTPSAGDADPPLQEMQTPSAPGADKLDTRTRKETLLTESKEAAPSSAEGRPGLNDLEAYLGHQAPAVVQLMDQVPEQPRSWPRTVMAIYGPSGTDETVWSWKEGPETAWVSPEDRPKLLATALLRLAGEGHTLRGQFFRAIIRKVVAEAQAPLPPGGGSRAAAIQEETREAERRTEAHRRMVEQQAQKDEEDHAQAEAAEAEVWEWWEDQDESTRRKLRGQAMELAAGGLTGPNPPEILVRAQLFTLIQEARGNAGVLVS